MMDRTWQEASSGTGLLDAPVRRAGTPNWHYASMRCAEQSARSISVRRSVGSIPADELDAAKAVQTSYYLLAAAHRAAARRIERPQRIRARIERVLWPVVRIVRSVRRAVTA